MNHRAAVTEPSRKAARLSSSGPPKPRRVTAAKNKAPIAFLDRDHSILALNERSAAHPGRAGPRPPVSPGRQQVPELHRAPRRQGCVWTRERNRDRQGAEGAAAPHAAAVAGGGQAEAAGVAVQRDPRPSRLAVPGTRGAPVLPVPRNAALRSGGGRGGRAQPADRLAPGAAAAPLRPGRAPGSVLRLLGLPGGVPAPAVRAAAGLPVPRARPGEPRPPAADGRPGRGAEAAVPAVPARLPARPRARPADLRAAAEEGCAHPPAVREPCTASSG